RVPDDDVTPPYSLAGNTPSKWKYSIGWSSTCMANLPAFGSRVGPFGRGENGISAMVRVGRPRPPFRDRPNCGGSGRPGCSKLTPGSWSELNPQQRSQGTYRHESSRGGLSAQCLSCWLGAVSQCVCGPLRLSHFMRRV